ncbi:hypothetical protein EEJ42_12630 [Streptomyces botrytidirepellens]|uniref:Uncharacterized protein n=1 Tax=Streptomyces botrytidirepellens TaxID=2486417 RepID=A0A3M8WHC1_9ACTN|nr:hypothetical protein EEJ42_12630 [Streptomyces botrytidirepellens]
MRIDPAGAQQASRCGYTGEDLGAGGPSRAASCPSRSNLRGREAGLGHPGRGLAEPSSRRGGGRWADHRRTQTRWAGTVSVDSTVCRAHHHATGARKKGCRSPALTRCGQRLKIRRALPDRNSSVASSSKPNSPRCSSAFTGVIIG